MTVTRTKPVSLEEMWDFEDKHPVLFASSRVLAEARMMADLSRLKRRRRPRRVAAKRKSPQRKLTKA